MSLGFLTESALLPSKAKEIKVDSKSILDLKAVVFRKEQEREERRRRLHDEAGDDATAGGGSRRRKRRDGESNDYNGGDGDTMSKSVYARLKARKRNRASEEKNRGVDARRRRDEEQCELDVENEQDDAALQRKSREMLERKAKLYEQMMQGKRGAVPTAAVKECLVDFDEKRRTVGAEAIVGDDEYGTETVEITDEFGRTRVVRKGSDEHLEYVQGQEKQQQQQKPGLLFFEDKRRDRADRRDTDTDEALNSGSFVVSQWEKTLNFTEKGYLEEVRASTTHAKQSSASMDKQRRKQLRLEKLRQQQQQPSASTPAPQELAGNNVLQDAEAAVKATAFLNQFTSLME